MAADGKDTEKVPVTEILEEDDEFEVRRRISGKNFLLAFRNVRERHASGVCELVTARFAKNRRPRRDTRCVSLWKSNRDPRRPARRMCVLSLSPNKKTLATWVTPPIFSQSLLHATSQAWALSSKHS